MEPPADGGGALAVDLPAGEPELRADISVPSATDAFVAELVSPSGLAEAAAANALPSTKDASHLVAERGAQLHVVAPRGGVWTLALDFVPQVSGTAVFQPIAVTLSTAPATVSAPNLPDGATAVLPAGHPTTVASR